MITISFFFVLLQLVDTSSSFPAGSVHVIQPTAAAAILPPASHTVGAADRERQERAIAKALGELQRLESQLSPSFIQNAPSHVVEATRTKIDSLKAQVIVGSEKRFLFCCRFYPKATYIFIEIFPFHPSFFMFGFLSLWNKLLGFILPLPFPPPKITPPSPPSLADRNLEEIDALMKGRDEMGIQEKLCMHLCIQGEVAEWFRDYAALSLSKFIFSVPKKSGTQEHKYPRTAPIIFQVDICEKQE